MNLRTDINAYMRGEKLKARIIGKLKQSDMTVDELQVELNEPHQCVSARVSELLGTGFVRATGKMRITRTGSPANVWSLSREDDPHAEPRRKNTRRVPQTFTELGVWLRYRGYRVRVHEARAKHANEFHSQGECVVIADLEGFDFVGDSYDEVVHELVAHIMRISKAPSMWHRDVPVLELRRIEHGPHVYVGIEPVVALYALTHAVQAQTDPKAQAVFRSEYGTERPYDNLDVWVSANVRNNGEFSTNMLALTRLRLQDLYMNVRDQEQGWYYSDVDSIIEDAWEGQA